MSMVNDALIAELDGTVDRLKKILRLADEALSSFLVLVESESDAEPIGDVIEKAHLVQGLIEKMDDAEEMAGG